MVDRNVARHSKHERGLTHRGTCRKNHQIRGLPTERLAVDTHEARGHTTERILVLTRLLNRLQRLGQHTLRVLHRSLDVTLGHAENLLLGKTNQLGHVLRLVVRHTLNLGRRTDQLALDILLRDDLGVELDVSRRTHLLRELRQEGRTTHLFELALRLESLGNGIKVNGFQFAREILDRLIDRAMNRVIEGLGSDELLHGYDTIFVEHQRTEHRLFKLDSLRGHGTTDFGQCLKRLTVLLRGRFVLSFSHKFRSVGGVKV